MINTPIRQQFHDAQTAALTTEGSQEILNAIRSELRRTLDSEKFGVRELYKLAALATKGRELLADALSQVDSLVMQQSSLGGYNAGGAFVPSNSDENFGASAIKELIPALSKQKEEPIQSLLEAADQAKTMELDDVYERLLKQINKRLGDEPKATDPVAATFERVAEEVTFPPDDVEPI